MRDIALTLIFAGILPYAVRYTWIGVLLWNWVSLMTPHKLTWGFASTLPFAMITALATLVSVLVDRRNLRLRLDGTLIFIVLWVLWMVVTTFNAFFVAPSTDELITVLKIQLMVVVAIAALRERRHIEAFIWVIVLSVGFYGVKGGIFTIITGGGSRVWGPPDSYFFGNNEIGLALTMIIPLANYLRVVSPHRWVRLGLLFLMTTSAAAVLGTQSRGALLAIAAMVTVLWLRSRQKVVGGVVLLVVAAGLVAFMPQSWDDRMRSITAEKKDDSILSRYNSWEMAFNLANDRITGGGYAVENISVFSRYAPDPRWVFTAHSIYFQALGEQGWIGLFLFMGIGATTFWTTQRMRWRSRDRPETLWQYELAGMIQVSMVGYATGGAFLSLTYLDLAYNVAVIAIACKGWMLEERWKTELTGLFGSGAPIGRLPKVPRQPHGLQGRRA